MRQAANSDRPTTAVNPVELNRNQLAGHGVRQVQPRHTAEAIAARPSHRKIEMTLIYARIAN